MNRRLTCFAAVGGLMCLAAVTMQLPAATGAADLMAKMPASSPSEGQALAEQIIKLGAPGIKEIAATLVEPGKGDDSKARFALHGVVLWANRPGAEAERKLVEGALLDALADVSSKRKGNEVQAFLIRQIQLVGSDAAVGALSKLLSDARLCEPAAQALAQIGTPKAAGALSEALGGAKGKSQLTIIYALGGLGPKAPSAGLAACAASSDADVRHAAWFALASIPDATAADVLAEARKSADRPEQLLATRYSFLLAGRLIDAGSKDAAVKIARDLLANGPATRGNNIPCVALAMLTRALGAEANADLLAAMAHKDKKVREAALRAAGNVAGEAVTAQWVAKAAAADTAPQVRAEIVAMLGRRGDRSAVAGVTSALSDKDAAVRLAAIDALARFGIPKGPSVQDALAPLLAVMAGDQADDIRAVHDALLWMRGEGLEAAVAAAIPKASAAGKAALLEVLAARGATGQVEAVFAAAADADGLLGQNVRQAAFRAMESVATAKDLPRIVDLMLSAKSPGEAAAARKVIVGLCRASAGADQAVLDALAKAAGEKRAMLLGTLSRIGGAAAMRAVVADTAGAEPTVQDAAVRALADWPDAAASDELLKLARQAPNKTHKVLALRGYVRVVSLPNERPAEKTVAMLKEAAGLAQSPADKKLVLAGLGKVRSVEALKLLSGYLDDEGLKEEAAAAAVQVACPRDKKDSGLAGPVVEEVLQKVVKVSKNKDVVNKAQAHLRTIGPRAEAGPRSPARLAWGGPVATPAPAPAPKASGSPDAPAPAGPATAATLNVPPKGFIALFNGKDLTGWKGLVGSPESRAKMTPEQLAKAQKAADEKMRQHWKVQDGGIIYDGRNNSLCTAKDYGDFELYVDWKIPPGGDSGIYLRGSPQVQIWCDKEGSGGLYNNQKNPRKPLKKADNPPGEWNRFRIRMIGERVSVWLNGQLVVDNVVMENYWNPKKPIYPTGQIELQHHGSTLWFRNIFLREIPPEEAAAATQPSK